MWKEDQHTSDEIGSAEGKSGDFGRLTGRWRIRRVVPALLAIPFLLSACSSPAPADQPTGGTPQASPGEDLLAPALAATIHSSRDRVLEQGTRPMPKHIRTKLAPFFDANLLDSVRWARPANRFSLDTLVAHWSSDYSAITLEDVVVFFEEDASDDLKTWTHEMLHVQQVRSEGLAAFAREYTTNWRALEARTRSETDAILARMDQFDHEEARPGLTTAAKSAGTVGGPSGQYRLAR